MFARRLRRAFPPVRAAALALALSLVTAGAGCGDAPEARAGDLPEEGEPSAGETAADESPAGDPVAAALADLDIAYGRSPRPGLLTAGQLTPEQFEALEERGIRHFINLRTEGESGTGWEEQRAPAGHYVRIPVSGAAGLTRENAERLALALEEAGDEPAVLYCGSSNRVGALLALKAYWLDGADAATALELGRAGGLTRLEPQVKEILGLEK